MILAADGGPLYRGMRNLGCYEKSSWTVNVIAYLRREELGHDGTWIKKDLKGISVAVSKRAVFTNLIPRGIAEVQASLVRSIQNKKSGERLEIFADPPIEGAQHGNIVDIPYLSDDPETAEFLAGELARNSYLLPDAEFNELKATASAS